MNAAWTVFRKELLDALRDRRTLLMVLVSSVAIGPLVLVLISALVSGMEKRAEARELVVLGIEHAPTLANYLEQGEPEAVSPPTPPQTPNQRQQAMLEQQRRRGARAPAPPRGSTG